jgi:F-type H+-transporting ATPase subunit b
MGDILNQLGQLFLQSIPTVIFVFFLLVILDWLFFRPLTQVLRKREDATVGALARAREQSATAENKAREYDAAFQAARQEVYRRREVERKVALQERETTLQEGREQSEVWRQSAQATLRKDVEAVKQDLQTACRSLAQEITESVLGAAPSSEGKRGA